MSILPEALAKGNIHIKVMNFVYCLTIQLIFIILFAFAITLFNWNRINEEQNKKYITKWHYTQVQGKKLYIALQSNKLYIALQGNIVLLPCSAIYRFIAQPHDPI